MPYDLRTEPWLPFRRRSGAVEWLPPFAITDRLEDDPIVALAAPRPDFNGALHEFLIGLFSVALALPDREAWEELEGEPPSPEDLKARLMALPDAFMLDGDGPRFLQDYSAADFDEQPDLPIENLLIDAAGENTQKLNKDLFVKRGRADALGYPAAAMALITLQTYAPSGGQGHRTSMRGGGPLTTLVEPRGDGRKADRSLERPLWEMIHANLQLAEDDAWLPEDWRSDEGKQRAPLIWPWLAPTITSEKPKSRKVMPQDAHAFQAFFGMPRRIRLTFSDGKGRCGLTGASDDRFAIAYRAINFGVDYGSGLWLHPLSPHYKNKNEWLPVHPQPDGLGWKDWAGLVLGQRGGKSEQKVAAVVQRYQGRRNRPFAVRAFGYDMDNMKARGWAEVILPAWPLADDGLAKALTEAARQMTEATEQVAKLLTDAVIAARFSRREDAKGDFSFIKAELWAATQTAFYDRIDHAVTNKIDHAQSIVSDQVHGKAFLDVLRNEAARIFDRHAEAIGLDVADNYRFVMARRNLMLALRGYGKAGKNLFIALGLPPPEKSSKNAKEKAA
jgi:CRISPR system Cascade subunit CasA